MKNLRRMLCFAGRCAKEIVRDPLTLFFGLAFPILLLLLLSLAAGNGLGRGGNRHHTDNGHYHCLRQPMLAGIRNISAVLVHTLFILYP